MHAKTALLAKVAMIISFVSLLSVDFALSKAEGLKSPYKTEVKDGWLCVNGERFFVKGVVYEGWRPGEAPGAQDPDLDLVDNDFKLIKEGGFNTIRTAGGLTPEMIALAKKHGLMVMYGTWFNQDIDFRDPDKIAYAVNMIKDDVTRVKKFDNIIAYLVMNEPSTGKVKEAGTPGTEAFYKKIKEAARSAGGLTPVSMADWIPTAFLDHSMWDVVCFNAYIYSPSSIAYSLGFQRYVEWLKEEKARNKPLIFTEFGLSVSKKTIGQSEAGCFRYGGNTLEEQKEALLRMYDDIIASDAQGACVHEWIDAWWRPSDPSEHADQPEEWYGLLGIDDKNSDRAGTPRPAYYALKEYNRAIVISPKALRFYRGQVPAEVYTTEDVALVQYRMNGKGWTGLVKEGNFWWKKEIDSKKEKDGKQAFEIRALDKNKNILCIKKMDLWIANTTASLSLPSVGIAPDKDVYAAGQKMKVKISVADADNNPIPNQAVYYSFFQPAGWVESKGQGVTDGNGEVNTQFATFEPGYVLVSAGVKYKSGDFKKRCGNIKTVLFK